MTPENNADKKRTNQMLFLLLGTRETTRETSTYTLGGTVSGLAGTVVLTNNGVDKTITENGNYTFDTYFNSGLNYRVTIKVQPNNLTCTVANGKGILNSNITNVDVSCNMVWNGGTLPSSANWESVTYGNDKFVTVTSASNKLAYSSDGITWIESTLPSSADWKSVTYGSGSFVAVPRDSNKVAYSQ